VSEEWPEFVRQGKAGEASVFLWVQPGAKRDGVAGIFEGRLKVRLKARAQENKANEALCAYLADLLEVPCGALTIVSGHAGRKKTIRVRAGVAPNWRFLEKALTDKA